MPIPFYRPSLAPLAVFAGVNIPESRANWLSRLTFQWVTPIMKVGYSRPLEADDLWTLTPELQCQEISKCLEKNFVARLPPSKRPSTKHLHEAPSSTTAERDTPVPIPLAADPQEFSERRFSRPPSRAVSPTPVPEANALRMEPASRLQVVPEAEPVPQPSTIAAAGLGDPENKAGPTSTDKHPAGGSAATPVHSSGWLGRKRAKKIRNGDLGEEDGVVYDQSLLKAMYNTIWRRWWPGVIVKGLGAVLQVTAPLVTRLIIEQITLAHQYHLAQKAGTSLKELSPPRSIGYGAGLAVALFAMLMTASLLVYQALQIGSVVGFMMRSALIDLIGQKSLRLSSRARGSMTDGRLTTMVSADASFLDFSAPMTLDLVVQPLQIVVGMVLLIYTLGYSALVGLAVLASAGPVQAFMFTQMVKYRQKQLVHVDARVRLLSEVIENIRAVKLYAYGKLFGEQVRELRKSELKELRKNGFNRATMNATMAFIPTLAAVLTFITYGLSGHDLDPATIFTGLQFFNVLKTPIAFLPMALTAVSDAAVAIRVLMQSEEMPRQLLIDRSSPNAISVVGDFTFESTDTEETGVSDNDAGEKPEPSDEPFTLQGIQMAIPKGALVCIVGRVGTGKSALLSGLLGEMRQTTGQTTFSDAVSYVPQDAWIHNGTIRDNITFSAASEDIDQVRLKAVIVACGLESDVRGMPNGLFTRVGEKGISLSGGQKQRIALARAAYDTSSSIVLLDDPLSAVDANVSHQILNECILQGPLSARTSVMVTHDLDVVSRADWVVVMDRQGQIGSIAQQGPYHILSRQPGILQTLLREHAPRPRTAHSRTTILRPQTQLDTRPQSAYALQPTSRPLSTWYLDQEPSPAFDMEEEREVGVLPWSVYTTYVRAMGSWGWVAVAGVLLCLTQMANVSNSLFLGFWAGNELGLPQTSYMVVYACLGVGIAIFTWSASFIMFLAGIRASYHLFNSAWDAVLRAPVSWHDQTPSGRIINRLSKDIEMLDDRMAFAWEQMLATALAVVGTFGLVLYVYPYLGIAFIPLCILYCLCAAFYRQTSREIKRVDSISKSFIYSSFSEQLGGLSVIRAFRKQGTFERRLQSAINNECQAYIITITIQRWLGVRLDLFSNLLVMLIAIIGAVLRDSVNPSKFGVVLTYTLAAAALFANLVSLYAQVEQEMNNAERVLHYTNLPSEPTRTLDPDDLDPNWPSEGEIHFDGVYLRYRPDLPHVLRGLSFTVGAGEKVGIIGRTGAGKSSIAQALFRMVELDRGGISIDDVDTMSVDIDELRSRLAIIPQDAFLFEGSIRSNIDPAGVHPDAELNACLDLILSDPMATEALRSKLALDCVVSHEGANFSAGEKQLVALVRALMKGTKIVLLDEATSSVDPETDALIQRVIQSHFKHVTLLSIAHRLQTVAYYDRILVMDQGQVVEFDTPIRLFDNRSTLRSLCDRVGLRRQDLIRLKHDAEFATQMARDRSSLLYHFTVADAWEETGPRGTWFG